MCVYSKQKQTLQKSWFSLPNPDLFAFHDAHKKCTEHKMIRRLETKTWFGLSSSKSVKLFNKLTLIIICKLNHPFLINGMHRHTGLSNCHFHHNYHAIIFCLNLHLFQLAFLYSDVNTIIEQFLLNDLLGTFNPRPNTLVRGWISWSSPKALL